MCKQQQPFSENSLNLNFFVEDNPIEIYAEVLRVQRVNGDVDGYGCQFQNVDQNQEEMYQI